MEVRGPEVAWELALIFRGRGQRLHHGERRSAQLQHRPWSRNFICVHLCTSVVL